MYLYPWLHRKKIILSNVAQSRAVAKAFPHCNIRCYTFLLANTLLDDRLAEELTNPVDPGKPPQDAS
jgi:hypothetical protein